MKYLNLGWNNLGSSYADTQVSAAIAYCLKINKTLFHLDISNNNLNSSSIVNISEGIKLNHTLYGIHVEGNEAGWVDS